MLVEHACAIFILTHEKTEAAHDKHLEENYSEVIEIFMPCEMWKWEIYVLTLWPFACHPNSVIKAGFQKRFAGLTGLAVVELWELVSVKDSSSNEIKLRAANSLKFQAKTFSHPQPWQNKCKHFGKAC